MSTNFSSITSNHRQPLAAKEYLFPPEPSRNILHASGAQFLKPAGLPTINAKIMDSLASVSLYRPAPRADPPASINVPSYGQAEPSYPTPSFLANNV